jgi:transcriptional regulator with XRE-family HTH domain
MKKYTTGERLKQIMAERHMTQADILKAAEPFCKQYNVKLYKSNLSQYINGHFEPSQDKLYILGQALNVSEAWLMGCDVPMEKPTQTKSSEPPARDPLDEKILQLFSQLTPEERREVLGLIFEKLHSRGAI